jgi:hypothetical protein
VRMAGGWLADDGWWCVGIGWFNSLTWFDH